MSTHANTNHVGKRGPRPSLFGRSRGPDVRDFGVPGHTPLLLQVPLAAHVQERLAALETTAEVVLLLGIATLEKERQAAKNLARDRADVVPLPVHPYRHRSEAPIQDDERTSADVCGDLSDRLVEA